MHEAEDYGDAQTIFFTTGEGSETENSSLLADCQTCHCEDNSII